MASFTEKAQTENTIPRTSDEGAGLAQKAK
jgi:hypothetical protein